MFLGEKGFICSLANNTYDNINVADCMSTDSYKFYCYYYINFSKSVFDLEHEKIEKLDKYIFNPLTFKQFLVDLIGQDNFTIHIELEDERCDNFLILNIRSNEYSKLYVSIINGPESRVKGF